MRTFQDIVATLSQFWASHGCIIATPYDLEKGAGTSNPTTFLRALGPEPYNAAYIEPCRRPKDGRYGENPNRLQHYFQYQVILKPSPDNILELYLESLKAIGLDIKEHDIRFVHDDWENPTLGAWGLGWEIWIDGMEMTQFTYFQAVAGIPLQPITGEITYGIERIAMCLQGVDSIFDIKWTDTLTYGDIYKANEIQWSHYNFEAQNDAMWARHFTDFQTEAKQLVEKGLPIPAYDFVVKASHAFNMLDAKGVISVTQRAHYISSIRDLAKRAAEGYLAFREKAGYPLLKIAADKEDKTQSAQTSISPQSPTAPFVLEIGVEELPATFVPIGIRELERHMKELLAKHALQYSSLKAYGTPRRLAVFVEGLSTETKEEREERRGPPVSNIWDPESHALLPAGKGFFTSIGFDDEKSAPQSIEEIAQGKFPELSLKDIKGAQYLFHLKTKPAEKSIEILSKELPQLIHKLEFPKSMKWGDYTDIAFARPIRWILALFEKSVVPFSVAHIHASNITKGNRQLTGSIEIPIQNASEYELVLEEKGLVIVDHKKRMAHIEEQLARLQKEHAIKAIETAKVIRQVVHLIEKPFLALLSFDPAFLEAPREVLVSEMVEHQKYFPVEDAVTQELLPSFIIVANRAVNVNVEKGNKKVLSARLSDGRFLWHEDKKSSLEEMREKLKSVAYQTNAGTVYQKTERLHLLSPYIFRTWSPTATDKEISEVSTAAALSKADLTSHLVGEFPELQGTIGMHLALHQKLPKAVSIALQDHWLPNQEGGALPSSDIGLAVSLADKLDTLSIFFSLGLKPTSSSDPFALRRAAIGVVRMLVEKKMSLSLTDLVLKAVETAHRDITKPIQIKREHTAQEIISFILTRARAYASEKGYEKECIETVLTEPLSEQQQIDLFDAFSRLQALSELKKSPERMKSFIEVLKRCIGQVDGKNISPLADGQSLKEPSEIALYTAVKEISCSFSESEEIKSWEKALSHLLRLQKPIDDLFSEVKVLSDVKEEKDRRLSLLQSALQLINRFGDMKRFCGFK